MYDKSQTYTNNFVLGDKMCTAAQDHCPSCYNTDREVYSRPCTNVYELQYGQLVYVIHTVNYQKSKIALKTCDRCKRRGQHFVSQVPNLLG
jgi:hypothetical protein